MAIVVVVLLSLPVLGWVGALSWPAVVGWLGGGALVAAIGFADDHGHIAPRWRLLGQFAAAAWIVTQLGGAPDVAVFHYLLHGGWTSHVLATIYLVWLTNLFNFMDGIDGIAGVETLTVCVGAALLSVLTFPGQSLWLAAVVLASATLGFLVWNWPPARIFMGDAGAGFLGLMLGALSLENAKAEPRLFWSWVILLGVFIVDATVTLIRRVVRREKFYEAHRSHAYQRAALRWRGHRRVTILVGVINLCWLLPIALLVGLGVVDGLIATVIAYTPLVVIALWLGAGSGDVAFTLNGHDLPP